MTDPSSLPGRRRLAAAAVVLLLAPVFAELSSGYLESTGDPVLTALDLLFLIPLYGFVALLVREVAVARGLGWSGVLLLAAAFGTLQAGLVDRSIFTLTGTGIDFWPDLMDPTWVPALGVAAGAALGWVLGHVVASIGAPLAVASLLVPAGRGRRMVPTPLLVVMTLVWLVLGAAVHLEVGRTYRPVPSVWQYAAVVAVAAGLVVLALGPAGRPRGSTDRWAAPGLAVRWLAAPLVGGAVVMLLIDQAHLSWAWTAICVAAVSVAGWACVRASRSRWWSPLIPAALALGAMLMRAAEAFWTPLPKGVTVAEMRTHNLLFLALVAGLVVVLVGAARRDSRGDAPRTSTVAGPR